MAGERTEALMRCGDHDDFVAVARQAIDARLDQLVPETGLPAEAARHSLLLPGKRLRGLLTLAAADLFGCSVDTAIDPACAVEMVHAASLIFDDLPAMDDAGLRRGAETPHILFGEDVAILAGIGLLNGAFGVLTFAKGLDAERHCEMVRVLSEAVGWRGLVQGQALDLSSAASTADSDSVRTIHDGKTGALFVASALMGAIVAKADGAARDQMVQLGQHLGLAYQAFDDVLDAVASAEEIGKPTRADGLKGTAMALSSGIASDALSRAEQQFALAKSFAGGDGTCLMALLDLIGAHFEKLIVPAVSAA